MFWVSIRLNCQTDTLIKLVVHILRYKPSKFDHFQDFTSFNFGNPAAEQMSDVEGGRGEFVKAGYLVKSPPLSRSYVSQWHRRWFLLMDSRLVHPFAERYVRLVYYRNEADAKRLADPKGEGVGWGGGVATGITVEMPELQAGWVCSHLCMHLGLWLWLQQTPLRQ